MEEEKKAIRMTFTSYETPEEKELYTKFKKELKEIQSKIKGKEHNKISIPYTTQNQRKAIITFKKLLALSVKYDLMDSLMTNVLDKNISSLLKLYPNEIIQEEN